MLVLVTFSRRVLTVPFGPIRTAMRFFGIRTRDVASILVHLDESFQLFVGYRVWGY